MIRRSEQLALQITGARLPIDIEIARARRIRSPLQYVEPPHVIGTAHAHMVRNEVENLAEAVRLQRVDHRPEIVLAAELGIERVVVHDIVAVGAPGPRLQIRRRVQMTDPERGQIRRQPGGCRESEILRQLQTIRGARNGWCGISGHRGTCGWSEADGRMLVGGAGEVHLVPFVSQIIELHHGEPGPCAGEKSVHGVGQVRAKWAGRVKIGQPQPGGLQCVEERHAFLRSLLVLAPFFGRARIKPMSAFQLDVVRFPPSAQGREIVAARRGQRERRIVLRLHEGTVRIELEEQHTVRQDARSLHSLPEALGNGAEILADDQAAVSTAFEG